MLLLHAFYKLFWFKMCSHICPPTKYMNKEKDFVYLVTMLNVKSTLSLWCLVACTSMKNKSHKIKVLFLINVQTPSSNICILQCFINSYTQVFIHLMIKLVLKKYTCLPDFQCWRHFPWAGDPACLPIQLICHP